ncbi:FecR family protein [Sphingobacterium griseoflavum]|uniref:Iron dicitrate transporter FecR n=1 Tax=Sphingobacterium griseoflavum TaxID=1474952 RepID=A0ABQ3HZX2_9SPHI|nr:FecR family protein [Sphingobacterium griseoflavum]GHE44548.1 iron dicitrate transporter FecR [Sphingobacterium griseoflavum]
MDRKDEEHLIHIASLLARSTCNDLSPMEQTELAHWLSDAPANQQLYAKVRSKQLQQKALEHIATFDSNNAYDRVKEQLSFAEDNSPVLRRKIWFGAAAAALLISCSFAAYLFFGRQQHTDLVAEAKDQVATSQKATIVLADGRTFTLDGGEKQIRMSQGALRDGTGKLIAETGSASSAKITTPKGATCDIQLSDGSLVKLNAASSLIYPLDFRAEQREVTLEGEGYFEVAKQEGKPFVVHTARQRVAVLGTHFNIAAYAGNEVTSTTLLEGSITVEPVDRHVQVLLRPGEQSVLNLANVLTKKKVAVEQEVAWLYGRFNFEGKHLREVMDEVSRWYDITVRYEGQVPNVEFFGGTFRSSKLNTILKLLDSNDIRYKLERDSVLIIGEMPMQKEPMQKGGTTGKN